MPRRSYPNGVQRSDWRRRHDGAGEGLGYRACGRPEISAPPLLPSTFSLLCAPYLPRFLLPSSSLSNPSNPCGALSLPPFVCSTQVLICWYPFAPSFDLLHPLLDMQLLMCLCRCLEPHGGGDLRPIVVSWCPKNRSSVGSAEIRDCGVVVSLGWNLLLHRVFQDSVEIRSCLGSCRHWWWALLCAFLGSAEMADQLIPHLMVGNCNDRICVRVSRFWDFFDPRDDKKLLHSDMVLMDEEGNTIHAQIYSAASERFRECIKEGSVYTFSYFRVKDSGDYKPVENKHMLSFSRWTKFEEVMEVPPAFPVYAYSLASMEQLQERVEKKALFTDVIGVITAITNIGAAQTIARQGESLKRTITICVPSGALLDVALWSEQATLFPAEEIHKNGQASPQIVIFVGALVKSFGGLSLSGGSSCKWYINPDVPEANALMASAKAVHQPITWAENNVVSSRPKAPAKEMKISALIELNPFECKKAEFQVVATVRKIDNSWWYNACRQCAKTAKRHGSSFKCTNPKCGAIGMANPRYKLAIHAGDGTGDADFILFGRTAQRLTKKTADTLIADNPPNFIPDQITRLLEKTFRWNVSFTENTIDSGNITFQVNEVKEEIDEHGNAIPATPAGSQASSLVLSAAVNTSIQESHGNHPLTLSSVPATSEASLASSATPAKLAIPSSEQHETPQSVSHLNETNPLGSTVDMPANSSTKTQKRGANKRSRPSPEKNIAKKLFIDEKATDDDGDSAGAAAADVPRGGPVPRQTGGARPRRSRLNGRRNPVSPRLCGSMFTCAVGSSLTWTPCIGFFLFSLLLGHFYKHVMGMANDTPCQAHLQAMAA